MRSSLHPRTLILAASLAMPVAALDIEPAYPEIEGDLPVIFTALEEGKAVPCEWALAEGSPGTIVRDEMGRGVYYPPAEHLRPCSVAIRALAAAGGASAAETKALVRCALPGIERVVSTGWQEARLGLLAGNPALAGHGAGKGQDVRFRNLAGAVFVPACDNPALAGRFIVADQDNDTLWVVDPTPGGWAWPLAGAPAPPGVLRGHKDGKGAAARLQGPTFLALPPGGGGPGQPWRCYVSDTGNHVVKVLDSKGTLRVYAGQPGVAGHDDGPLDHATFTFPRGLAVGADGAIYVAEGFSNTVRKIHRGKVTTLAGERQSHTQADGKGGAARFADLWGLALDERNGNLYATDLDALRRITPDGAVTTVAGGLRMRTGGRETAGFEDWMDGGSPLLEGPARLAGIPCFKGLRGLVIASGQAFLADGNETVRQFDLDTGGLATLAGHPGARESKDGTPGPIRFGPIRNGRDLHEAPPEERAALARPFQVAMDGMGGLVVTMGTCMAEIVLPQRQRSATEEPRAPELRRPSSLPPTLPEPEDAPAAALTEAEPWSEDVFETIAPLTRERARTVLIRPGAMEERKAPA